MNIQKWHYISFGFAIGLFFSGLVVLFVFVKPKNYIVLSPTFTPSPITVQISGEILNPGIYSLPNGSRVVDLIDKAGGTTSEKDHYQINFARILFDGERVDISSVQSGEKQKLININTASKTDLLLLPGIGPILAEKIIEYRNIHNSFIDKSEIQKVPGIGPDLYSKIELLIETTSK